MVDGGMTRAPHERLSDREFEVLRALGSGMMVKDVAAQLRLSAKTVVPTGADCGEDGTQIEGGARALRRST